MASNAFSGVGTVFNRGDSSSSSAVFTALAEVNGINGPNKTRGTIDVTSLDSTGGHREFIASFRDGGEVSLNMNFTIATYGLMNADFESSSSRDYQIVLQDTGNTTLQFTAWCVGLSMGVPLDDKVTSDVTLKVTGQFTITS